MTTITANFSEKIGKIKAMHAVGQPPRMGIDNSKLHWLTDAYIPYSRLHDMGGCFGGNLYVDVPNLFRDFSADVDNPDSYDFAFTDNLLAGLHEANVEPIFRLGVTIENYARIKPYRIFPPVDFDKWAAICEHIVAHYNEGWANGFHYDIKYWEIWNEPDGSPKLSVNEMWLGSMTDYFRLYEAASKRLKARFGDTIKVGGYASCGFYGYIECPGKYEENWQPLISEQAVLAATTEDRKGYFMEFFAAFLDYIRKNNCPIDFFSWHSYSNPKDTCRMADFVDRMLNKYGYTDLETQCNEWNPAHTIQTRGTSYSSAVVAEMMLRMQHKKTDIMCFYDARIGQSVYGGLFNPITYEPFCTYYSLYAFGLLYHLGSECAATVATVAEGSNITAIAATNEAGDEKALMIANTGVDEEVATDFADAEVWFIDAEKMYKQMPFRSTRFILPKNTVALLKWKKPEEAQA